MVNNLADWLCNVLVWASLATFAVLLYDSLVSPSFLTTAANPIGTLVGIAAVAGLAALWPKY